MQQISLRISLVACFALAMIVLSFFFISELRPNAKTIPVAQDAVYEAVVREMAAPIAGQANMSQLVFDQVLVTGIEPGAASLEACEEGVRQGLQPALYAPPFNSLADKIYRMTADGYDPYSIRPETIQDFAKMACIGGRLSETFQTDLPRAFISADSANFDVRWPNGRYESFAQRFPGAHGIIAFSHVGFDSGLDQALVSTSFVCGTLCGNGTIYVLRKGWGHWKVVNQIPVWES